MRRRSWEDNIKMDLKKSVRMWTRLTWLRLGVWGQAVVNTVMNLWIVLKAGNFVGN
jgi:hypothetical protein